MSTLSSDIHETIIDITGLSSQEANAQIRELVLAKNSEQRLRVVGAKGHHNLVTAVPSATITLEGNVGDYCAAALKDADVEVHGTAATGFGHSLRSGVVSVQMGAGIAAGAMASGGLLIIHGDAGPRCGAGLEGADIVIEGSVGPYAGLSMRGGTLVILGQVDAMAGYGATAGTWFVLGDIRDNAPCLVESRMKEADKLRLALLLLNSGLQVNAKDFRKYVIEPT